MHVRLHIYIYDYTYTYTTTLLHISIVLNRTEPNKGKQSFFKDIDIAQGPRFVNAGGERGKSIQSKRSERGPRARPRYAGGGGGKNR